MLHRNLLMPILMIVVIGAPIVYHEMESPKLDPAATNANQVNGQPNSVNGFGQFTPTPPARSNHGGPFILPNSDALASRNVSKPHIVPMEPPFQLAGFPRQSGDPVSDPTSSPSQQSPEDSLRPILQMPTNQQIQLAESSLGVPFQAQTAPVSPVQFPSRPVAAAIDFAPGAVDFSTMTPDYGAAETLIFPGNEFGPDLTAQPLENLPVTDFAEIFRFDLTKTWIQRRWKRISTNPVDYDSHLSGMRIPLVTGTNSWDLHGSLTYYFDSQQELQRITFRGWTGDPQKLVQLLTTQFQFEQQATQLAGFYLAQSWRRIHGGLLMKTPAVIDANNSLQQFGIVMELNRPGGSHDLSEDFRKLIAGSHAN